MAESIKPTLFYHIFICPDERGLFWSWWIDEQLGLAYRSKLHHTANIHVCITMPKYWTTIYDIPIYANNSDRQITLEEKVREYISLRYPFAKIIDIRDTGEENLFEGSTLQFLWKHCNDHPNSEVGYVHTKGVMSIGPHSKCWREVLNNYFITQWEYRLFELRAFGFDVVGITDKQCDGTQLSGNFWWAKTNYIRTLEKPIYSNRYGYEKWILSNIQDYKLKILENTGIDHFREYMFKG